MHYCSEVHLFEMIPSMRKRSSNKDDEAAVPCKYFSPRKSLRSAVDCSVFQGHQRQHELLALMRMNVASDEETYGKGHAVVPGLTSLTCPS
jgi:hypothetical protein